MESALTYDLLLIGRSIHDVGTTGLSWKELKAFIDHAPPTSAIKYLTDKMAPFKTAEALIMSSMHDALAGANWQRSGGKGPRPKPILEVIEKQVQSAEQDKRAPKNSRQLDDIRAALKRRRARSTAT